MSFSTWLRNWKRSLDRRYALYQTLRQKPEARRPAHRLRLEALEDRFLLSAYVVTSAADSNVAGTLLYGINQVNAGNFNEIDFQIGSVGSAQTINLGTQLPTLTASGVYINGLSQGGPGNTTPLITLNGSGAPIHIDGLVLQASGCTVTGLTVENFGANGIEVEGSNNLIGGTAAGAANIIIGNAGDGVKIDSGVSGNQVLGNYIGTNAAGNGGLGNGNGVEIVSADNTVGGLTATAGNVISGNLNDGVLIDHRATGVQVLGNYIGTNFAGNAAVANSIGIEVFGIDNTIGGTDPGAFNLISGNSKDGVLIDSIGSGNQVLGNYIGTNADGTAPVANSIGIEIDGVGNTIGGTVSGSLNLISGNSRDGVLIDSTSSGNQVLGNYIGTNFDATAAVANSNGIEVAGISNLIGGIKAGALNIISGNGEGVLIDSTANGNQVLGNYIGTNANGLGGVGNRRNGVEIAGTSNTVGGTVAEARNIISANGNDGVMIDSKASGNQLLGNYIGINASGNALGNGIGFNNDVPNGITASGVEIAGTNNTIGGTVAGARNIISANAGNDNGLYPVTGDGVKIDSGASGNQVAGNYVGSNVDGTGSLGNENGIEVVGSGNTIGGSAPGAGNLISGNYDPAGGGLIGLLISGNANFVLGNSIGVGPGGDVALPNNIGVYLTGSGNTIGGTAAADRNIISGNSIDGVDLQGTDNQVLGNYVGTDITGTKSLANGYGFLVRISAGGNTIGGTASGAGNLISGNSRDGVLIDQGDGGNNQVLGNSIGVNVSGTGPLGNSNNGIEINCNNNTIGGTVAGARNIISANGNNGVLIDNGVSGTQVSGNFIGTNADGTAALGNGNRGITALTGSNTIGGTASGAGNLISGNRGAGVEVVSGAQVFGNSIGTNAAGTAAVANSVGIILGSNNTVGGTASGARNLISGNSTYGVLIGSGASGNQVLGNYIGTDITGAKALANSIGIELDGNSNTVGGTVSGASNLISGDGYAGMMISGTSNQVLGNSIGVDTSGDNALADGTGIYIRNGSGNTIGGTVSGARNLLSGNSTDGMLITDGNNNQVLGNFIGTNKDGTAAVANHHNGIFVESGNNNTVGGAASGAGNLISGNNSDGVLITDSGNLVLGNTIGANAHGNGALGNSGNGIEIGGNNNTVGGTTSGTGNLISGNGSDGVLIDSGASSTQVLGNYIGTGPGASSSVGNSVNGIEVAGDNNVIGGTAAGARNFLSGNSKDGVRIDSGASGNQVLGNFVGTNADGNAAVANSIGIDVAGNSNTVGGTVSGASNLISGDSDAGMMISGSANQVLGNLIGVALGGNTALANGTGVVLSGSGNTLGGVASGARNVISGNNKDGILISGGTANQVLSNYIGTNADGSAAMGNDLNGIEANGNGNTIGAALGTGNLISSNQDDGVKIDSGASGNLVVGNTIVDNPASDVGLPNGIGIEVAGSSNTVGGTAFGLGNLISGNSHGMRISGSANQVLGNTILNNGTGVELDGSSNTIGGTVSGASNLISGNSGDGVKISGSGNQVLGNAIGTNAARTGPLANSGNGIEIAGNNNTVGGTASAARNLISGNSNDGVLIDSSASGNQVLGNYIGTDFTGANPLANSIGIELDGTSNTIGGASAEAGNLISGDSYAGMVISGSANQVLGNLIGVALGGNTALADGTGIYIRNGSGNTIGGTVSGARNLLSGNSTDGMLITDGNNNQVLGNFIGTNAAGNAALTNHHNGILVESGSGNTIGGAASGASNLISGNSSDGVLINGSNNQLLGNNVGTTADGTSPLANSGNGIEIGGNNNTVGGTDPGAFNLISGNSHDGVLIASGGSGNQILGNYIGTDLRSSKPLANNIGVELDGNNNTVGGTASGARNLISGNSTYGVLIGSSASGNQVLGNYIGTDITGAKALANSIGIELDGNNNTIGGASTGAGNLISGDSYAGMVISGSANQVLGNSIGVALGANAALANGTGIYVKNGSGNTIGGAASAARNILSGNSNDGMLITGGNNNQVLGNFVGTNATGSAAVANLQNGINVQSGSGNTFGGTAAGAGNLISGNSWDGLLIASSGNLVLGNTVGATAAGAHPLSNSSNGINVAGDNNTIGGTAAGARNTISGNDKAGVRISGNFNQVLGNYIGTNGDGNGPLGNEIGIFIIGVNNTIGGTVSGASNLISSNSADGVNIFGGGNQVLGNSIGTSADGTAALGNSRYGVAIYGNGNTVSEGDLISGNRVGGVLLPTQFNAASGNTVRQNSIFANGPINTGPGIILNGANTSPEAPSLSSATLSGTTLNVKGTITVAAGFSYVLDFYANPSGDPEGKVYLGLLSVTPTSTGTQNFTFTTTTTVTGTNPLITATLTDYVGNTSAFSNGVTSGTSLTSSPPSSSPPPSSPPPSSPPSSSPLPSNSPPTLSPLQLTLEIAIDSAAMFLQSNTTALLELEGFSETFLGQSLPSSSDLLSTILSDMNVSGSAGLIGLQIGINFADSLNGKAT